jgi:hypothetical protein
VSAQELPDVVARLKRQLLGVAAFLAEGDPAGVWFNDRQPLRIRFRAKGLWLISLWEIATALPQQESAPRFENFAASIYSLRVVTFVSTLLQDVETIERNMHRPQP